MIRFIDLRGQVYLDYDLPFAEQRPVFAFYDTVRDRFVGCCSFESRSEFRDYMPGGDSELLRRCESLMPPWVPE